MNAVRQSTGISADLMAELQAAADRLFQGAHDRQAAKQAAQRMDRMREENRSLFGVQDIGVDIIRQMRNGR